jgi:hypothetical protein
MLLDLFCNLYNIVEETVFFNVFYADILEKDASGGILYRKQGTELFIER